MKTKQLQRHVAYLATCALITSSLVSPLYAKDYANHWASSEISKWASKNVIQGYGDDTFRPNNNVTRAELATVLTNIFGLNTNEGKAYSDVSEDAWYAHAVAQVSGLGIMNDFDEVFKPNQNATREETAYAIATAYAISSTELENKFTDHSTISDWAVEAVETLASSSFIQGRPGNIFSPTDDLTRAELIKMIDNITCELFSEPGTYSRDIEGNVVINTTDVVLKDMNIQGNLYIAQGVGDGDSTLEDVSVTGTIFVNGGGENSIHLTNVTANTVKVLKPSGRVRLVSTGNSIKNIEVHTETIITGSFDKVSLKDSVTLITTKDTVISELSATANTAVKGEGTIQTVKGDVAISTNKPSTSSGGSGTSSRPSRPSKPSTDDKDDTTPEAKPEEPEDTTPEAKPEEPEDTEDGIPSDIEDNPPTAPDDEDVITTSSQLKIALEKVETYHGMLHLESQYTTSSWLAFIGALEGLENACKDPNVTIEILVEMMSEVDESFNRLEERPTSAKPSEIEIIFPNLDKYETLDGTKYTTETWNIFADALKAVQSLQGKEDLTAQELGAALVELIKAYDNLVELDNPEVPEIDAGKVEIIFPDLSKYESLNSSDYTEDSWGVFENALTAIQELRDKENLELEELKIALVNLITAYDNLIEREEIPSVKSGDVSIIFPNLDKYESLNSEDYTTESWLEFNSALKAVQALKDKEDLTLDELSSALTNLVVAHQGLVEREDLLTEEDATNIIVVGSIKVDLTLFKEAKEENYTEESWKVFQDALQKVEVLSSIENTNTTELVSAVKALTVAYDNLVTK